MGIVKDGDKIGHLSKSTRDNELARLQRINTEQLQAGSPYPAPVSSNKLPQHGDGANALSQTDESNIAQRPLKTADDESVIDLVPDENGVYGVAFNGSSKELAKIATEIAKGEIKSLGTKKLAYMADNIAAAAADTAEQTISQNIAKINDGSIEFYANNINILNGIAKKYPMLSKDEQIELANKQILANASAELLEYSKFLNGGSLPNDARLLGKNAGRMILKSLDAGASAQEVINMLLKAGISGRNSTAAKALLQTGDINAYNAVMRQGEAELIAELSNNVRANAKNEIIGQILNSAKTQAIKNDEMLKKGLGNQDLDDVTAKFISEKTGKEFEVAENGFGRELMKYEGKEASDDMKRSFSAWEAQGQKADITLNDGRKVVYLSPDEAVQLSYGNTYLYGHKSYEELMATKMAESLEQKFERLKTHPAYENLLKMRENKLAKELKGEKVGGSKPTVYYEPQSDRYLRTAGGGGIDNPEREIRISKSDVAKLRSGKADVALAIKLENSLEALTGDPAASGVLDHLLTRDFHLGTAQYKKGLVQAKTAENSRISSDEVAKTAENSRIQDAIDAVDWKGVEETQNFIIKARRNFEIKHNITPIKEFGTNYAEFYHGGANAIRKLFAERQGQVAGAFERKELEKLGGNGDIDLVWGEAKTANGDIKGYGLSKIEAKHLNDFASFNGDTPHDKLINGLNEIIEKGEIKPRSGQDGVNIEYNGFIIGINKGFNGVGDNKWVVTAFDNSISIAEKKAKTARTDNFTSEVSNLSQNSKPNSTTSSVKSQANLAKSTAEFAKAYNAIKNIGKYTGLFENDYKKIASLSTKDFTQRLKNDIQAYEELAGLQEIAYKATNGLLDNDEYVRYFNITQGEKRYLTKAQSIQDKAFEILDQAPNYISGLYNQISRLKALTSLSKEQDEALNKALKQVNQNALLDLAGNTNYKLMATKIKTALNALMRAKKILDEAPKPKATTTANKSQGSGGGLKKGFSTQAMNQALLNVGSGVAGGNIAMANENDPNKKAQAFIMGFLAGFGGSAGAMKLLSKNATKLAPQLARASEKMASELPGLFNDRPDILGGVLGRMNNAKDNFKNIFGGEKALGANKAKLKTAKDMAKNGADESQIWAKTSWYKDIDGKWKFEINPKGGELKEKEAPQYVHPLKKVLDDKELFKAYPQLENLSILTTNIKEDGIKAYFMGTNSKGLEDDAIFFDYEYLKTASKDDIKSTLYHELQHAVQKLEGFGAGGNTQNLSYKEYKNLAGESEARNVQTRLNKTYTKDDAIDAEFNRLLIKDIDNPKWQELKQKRREFILAGKQDEADKIKKHLDQREEFLKREAIKNVEEFSIYSPHPSKTLDIAPNERIVSYDGGVSASVELEKRFLDKNGMLDFNALRAGASDLPAKKSLNELKNELDSVAKSSDGKGNYIVETPAGDISIYAPYAKGHTGKFGKFGNGKENRSYASGAIVQTLKEPLFVTKRGEALHFYKAFKNENGGLDIISVSRNTNGKLEYKTIYKNEKYFENGKSTSDLIKMIKNDELVYLKGDAQNGGIAKNATDTWQNTADNSHNIRNHFSENSTTSSLKSQELEMAKSFSPELKASYEMRDKLLKSANEARAKLSQKGKDELEKLKDSKDSKLSRDAQIMKTLENAKSNPARYEKLKKLYLDENGKVKDSIGLC